jgi:hypothetical protein
LARAGALSRYQEVPKKDYAMLKKCANPSCIETLDFSRRGALFLFGTPTEARNCHSSLLDNSDSVESFWLCDECASSMTIISDRAGIPMIIPLVGDECPQIGTA